MNILTQNNQQSITSLQIAGLVGSRHDKVKQSIERLATQKQDKLAVIALPPMGVVPLVRNNRSYDSDVYIFSGEQGKRDSIIVVAQLSPEFTAALVDRWAELEARGNQPVMPALPQSFSEALLLAGTLQQKIEQDAPKVAHYNKVVDRHTLLTATQVGQKLGMSARKLNVLLGDLNVYNKSVKRSKVFNTWFMDKGLGELKQVDNGYDQALFTLKGEAWVIEQFSVEVA